jgi:hypothetical protein
MFSCNDCNLLFPSFVSYMIDGMVISKVDALTMSLPSRAGTCHHIESPYRHGDSNRWFKFRPGTTGGSSTTG